MLCGQGRKNKCKSQLLKRDGRAIGPNNCYQTNPFLLGLLFCWSTVFRLLEVLGLADGAPVVVKPPELETGEDGLQKLVRLWADQLLPSRCIGSLPVVIADEIWTERLPERVSPSIRPCARCMARERILT